MIRTTTESLQQGTIDALGRVRRSLDTLLTRVGVAYRSAEIRAGRHRIHYVEYGEGPPVVLLHGASPGAAIWFSQIASLGERYRVIAPDNPVAGLSDRTTPDRPMFEFAREYFLSFLDAMRLESIAVAGMSLGGLAALAVAIEQPQRVRRLALIASAGLGREVSPMFRLISVPPFSWLAWRPRQILAGYMQRAIRAAGERRSHLMALSSYSYHVSCVPTHRIGLLEGLRNFATRDGQRKVFLAEELAKIVAPTLIVWGARDRVFPVAHARFAHAAIPSSQLHVLDRAGHAVMLDEPDRVSALLHRLFAQ